jgi:hypothetical protein
MPLPENDYSKMREYLIVTQLEPLLDKVIIQDHGYLFGLSVSQALALVGTEKLYIRRLAARSSCSDPDFQKVLLHPELYIARAMQVAFYRFDASRGLFERGPMEATWRKYRQLSDQLKKQLCITASAV